MVEQAVGCEKPEILIRFCYSLRFRYGKLFEQLPAYRAEIELIAFVGASPSAETVETVDVIVRIVGFFAVFPELLPDVFKPVQVGERFFMVYEDGKRAE